MGKFDNVLAVILRGSSDSNIPFTDLSYILNLLEFELRIKGGHFIYTHPLMIEIVNIQPIGNKAKAYQVKQVRNLILKYKLVR